MKWMLIQYSDKNLQSSYTKNLIQDLQQKAGFKMVDAAEDPQLYSKNERLLLIISIKSNGKLSNWLNTKFKFQQIIKKWHIEELLLSSSLQIDLPIKQTIIIEDIKNILNEEIVAFYSSKNIDFVTYSEDIEKKIALRYPTRTIYPYTPTISHDFKSIDWESSLEIKEIYSDGEDYFLVNSSGQKIEDSIQILKGFSIFKKWQKSGMKILFIVDNVQAFQDTISNYKYREDVRITNQLDEATLAKVMASAYCSLHLTHNDSDNIFGMQSVQCCTPLLLRKESTLSKWLNDNAFLIDEITTETLGQSFITMYKAENIRSKYVDYMEQNPLILPSDWIQNLAVH